MHIKIQTKSFELAVNQYGDIASSKIALICPGRLDTKDYFHLDSHARTLGHAGYCAIAFDPPGTWETGGDIANYTMTNYLMAAQELIEHYGNKPTLVVGHSRGGSMAMLIALETDQVEGFVAIMSNASSSLGDMEEIRRVGYEPDTRDVPPGKERTKEQIPVRCPLSYFEDSIQYQMIEDLPYYSKPKMFMYGTGDILVPEESVRKGYDASIDPKSCIAVDAPHDYRLDKIAVSFVNEQLLDFIDKNLKD